MRLHRDHGDRGNRRHARLKYVIAENGEDWAARASEEYLGKTLEPCRGDAGIRGSRPSRLA